MTNRQLPMDQAPLRNIKYEVDQQQRDVTYRVQLLVLTEVKESPRKSKTDRSCESRERVRVCAHVYVYVHVHHPSIPW